ncbi:MAG: HDIG domain-containing protein [Verrucomicrobia bacterium]|nr:HDIG domain-containing protein [Verrucomicrobiota bacterium]
MAFVNETSELKFSREQGFFDKSNAVRWTIVLLFGLGLFSFLHFREVRIETLELGRFAPHYIVAEADFTFPDEEATTILKQEALLDIGKIFAIDPDDVRKRRLDFENILIYDQEWRKKVLQSTFDEMYRAIERLEQSLLEIRFSDARTIEKMKELGFPTSNYHELSPFDPSQGVFFPEKVWEFIRQQAFGHQLFNPATVDFVIDFLKNKIWTLKEDPQQERKLRKALQHNIQPKYTYVQAGSRIIDQGEKVTSRHIAMIQSMKQALSERRNLVHPRTIAGSLLLTIILMFVTTVFLRYYYPDILASNRRIFLLSSIVLLGMALAKITEFLLLKTTPDLYEIVRYPLLTPFTAILLCSLVNPGVAIFIAALETGVFDTVLAIDRHGFILANLIVAFFAILYTRTLRRRTEIFVVCTKAWLAACAIILAFYLYDRSRWGISIVADIASSGVFMLFTAVLVVGLLPVFEACFRILTDITLMEYMDPNHELLRRLTIEAPGTYQHSLIMGNIAEAAANAIGSNGLFCRVATLYHDIGKMSIAQYFTENQQPGVNIHQLLTPVESAQVIISHVSEGVSMARKAGLPEQFIDIIKEHHGNGLVYFFYHKQLEHVGGNRELANEKEFRYAGPKPRTKESVIIMIADSLEAASRSLDEVNEDTLTRLVDQIVKEKMEDGQFDESLLTFEELGRLKKAMVKSLLAIGHFRVKYPTRVRVKDKIQAWG